MCICKLRFLDGTEKSGRNLLRNLQKLNCLNCDPVLKYLHTARCEVLTAVMLKLQVFWGVTS